MRSKLKACAALLVALLLLAALLPTGIIASADDDYDKCGEKAQCFPVRNYFALLCCNDDTLRI